MNHNTLNQSAEAIYELLHIASDAALLALAGLDTEAAGEVGFTQAVAALVQLADATGWIAQHTTLASSTSYYASLRDLHVRLADARDALSAATSADDDLPF